MTIKGYSQAILVDEFIFNADTSSVESTITNAELDVTNIGSTAMEYIPGIGTLRIVQNGYFAGLAADGVADELYDRMGVTGAIVAHCFDRTNTNTPALVIPDAFNANTPIAGGPAGVITMNGEWAAAAAHNRGMLLCYNVTISGTGGGTSIDLGSAGSAGGTAFLFVHTIDGSKSGTSTNTDIDIESSSDDASFASEGTFTFSATDGLSVAMSGTVNRYMRINTTDLGGATTITASCIVAVSGVTE